MDVTLLFLTLLGPRPSSSQQHIITGEVRHHVLVLCVHLKWRCSKFLSSLCFDNGEGKAALIFKNYDCK